MFANFSGGEFINLTRLHKPYAGGKNFLVRTSSTTTNEHRFFDNIQDAEKYFGELINSWTWHKELIETKKLTQNYNQ